MTSVNSASLGPRLELVCAVPYGWSCRLVGQGRVRTAAQGPFLRFDAGELLNAGGKPGIRERDGKPYDELASGIFTGAVGHHAPFVRLVMQASSPLLEALGHQINYLK
jgi:hypothetical protein